MAQYTTTIQGNIKGLGNDILYIHSVQIADKHHTIHSDTIMAEKGRFSYTLTIDEPVFLSITPKRLVLKYEEPGWGISLNQCFLLVNEQETHIRIKGKIIDDYIEYRTNGTVFNQDFANYRMSEKDIQQSQDSLTKLIGFYTRDPEAPEVDSQVVFNLYEEINQLRKIASERQFEYIKNNPQNELSAFYLCMQPYNIFNLYVNTFHPNVKEGALKDFLNIFIDMNKKKELVQINKEIVKEGTSSSDFILKDIQGNDFCLSDIKYKYIVLDFWGSWCGWCMEGFPRMKEYYNKYKENVEFVGIACKDKEEAWREAVNKYQLPWIQLINEETEDINKNVTILYGVSRFPTKIILNKNLTIHSILTGENDDFYNTLDELLK